MKRWRFVFTRRWLGYLAFAIAFAAACMLLSNWQLARGNETAAENARIAANYDSQPVPLQEALSSLNAYQPGLEWSRVRAVGHYLVEDQLLVRNRPLKGNPGFEVLTPLQLADGSVFVIDRGWVPTGQKQDAPDTVPEPPAGQVSVVARLKAGEPRLAGRSASGNEIATIELKDVRSRIGGDVYTGAYGLLDTESPAPAVRPESAPRPLEDVGLHWSYMIQWIIFALIGFFGLGYAIRQEYRNLNADQPEEQRRAAQRQRKRESAHSDADAEDAILDTRHSGQ
ncbi:MAG: SURF1 family protein [Microbacteriaceae bacterium]